MKTLLASISVFAIAMAAALAIYALFGVSALIGVAAGGIGSAFCYAAGVWD